MLKLISYISLYFVVLSLSSFKSSPKPKNNESKIISISTLKELAEYAGKDSVHVKMKPGEYLLNDPAIGQKLMIKRYNLKGEPTSDYPITALINFSGHNSIYDLKGVVINLDAKLHQAYGRNHIFEIFVSGNNNEILGLKVQDVGDKAPIKGAIMMHVMGDDNTIRNVDLFIKGSFPYGYGHLLGKGGNTLVQHQKHSSLLVSGRNTKLLACKVVTRAFGHGIVMQGAVNTYIEDCYVEGEMRSTDEMLAETSGPAFNVDFKSDYPPGRIVPNEMKALSEDGVRTYPYGYLVGRKTKGVTVINTTVKSMRSGFDLSANQIPTKIIGCTTIGCQEKGYSIGSNGLIEDCKGDALYGSLITFITKDVKNCKVDLELVDTVSQYPVHRLAEINGSGHQIIIRNYQGKKRSVKTPIVFGESFWADVHHYRKPNLPLGAWGGTKNITLVNETGMPVVFNELTSDCKVVSNDKCIKNEEKVMVINKGIGGNSTVDLLKRIDTDILSQQPDLVILMVGTNDMLNSRKMLSYETYQNNLNKIVRKIKTSGSKILMMSPPPADSAYLFQRHDKELYKQAPNEIMHSVSHIVRDVAQENKALFIDLFAEFTAMNIPRHNQDLLIRNVKNCNKGDGVHPTPLGYHFIAQMVYQYLKENKLLASYKKIICFGDSITNGAGAKGGGTVKGENYPSYLHRMLNGL